MAENENNKAITSVLLRSLVERRADIEKVLMKQPDYKELCAINFLIETEYLRVAQEGDPYGDGSESKYHSYSQFAEIMLSTFIDGSGKPPETNSGFAVAEELAQKNLEPQVAGPLISVSASSSIDLHEESSIHNPEQWPKPRSEYIWPQAEKERLVTLRRAHPEWHWRQIGDAMGRTGPQCSSMYHAMKSRGEILDVPDMKDLDQEVWVQVKEMLVAGGARENIAAKLRIEPSVLDDFIQAKLKANQEAA